MRQGKKEEFNFISKINRLALFFLVMMIVILKKDKEEGDVCPLVKQLINKGIRYYYLARLHFVVVYQF